MNVIFTDHINWIAFGWFVACWVGYTFYAKRAVKTRDASISAVIFKYRIEWIKDMMRRELRVPDLILLGNLVQMVNFMATTTIFVLAGLITILYSSESVLDLLKDHSFVTITTQEQVQFKILTLVIIFIYAFFRFTWAMRQHSFCSILIGSAPHVKGPTLNDDEMQFAMQLARISDRAGHEFNYGLRSYYFALSFLGWFVSPYALMITCTAVVVVLYRREFRSKTLEFMTRSRESYTRLQAAHYAAIASNIN